MLCSVLAGLSVAGVAWAAEDVAPVKYVFLFIGDGMSMPQRMVTQEYLNLTEKRGLLINELPSQGFSTTFAADQFITDSAASGTAIACGSKTNCGALGVDANGNRLESIATVAKKNDKKVGILSSVTLNHATPAAFYSHNVSRSNLYDIALEVFDSNFDLFAGGTFGDINGKNNPNTKGNILDLAREKGYTVTTDKAGFDALAPSDKKVIAVTPRFGEAGSMPYSIDMNDADITLAQFTQKAIDLLDNENGFFIMVEGGKIDWMCHANDAGTTVHEVIGLDDAVRVAYNFAQQHPDDTLIVVTGDHETGGLTLGFSGTGYQSFIERLKNQKISMIEFLPLYSKFKNDAKATFDDVKPLLTEQFGFKFDGDAKDPMFINEYEAKKLSEAFSRSRGNGTYSANEDKLILYGGYDPFAMTVYEIMANKSGLAWNTFAHTALPVATSAYGKNAEKFGNMSDNTDIAKRLKTMVVKP